MQVLVTGATGFIGSHLAEHLVKRGYRIRALIRPGSDAPHVKALGGEIVCGDLRNATAVQRAVTGCAHVYHLAALTSRRGATQASFEAVNVDGTERVARAALRAGVTRMVHVSTGGVYGFTTHEVLDESHPLRPNFPYRASKAAAEAVVQSYCRQHALPVVTARLSSVIGPRSMSWLGLFRAVATPPFRIIGPGENHLPLCPVSDLVNGLRLCAETPDLAGETFLFAGRKSITLNGFLGAIAQALNVAAPTTHRSALPFRLYHRLALAFYRHTNLQLPRAHTYEFFLASRRFDISKARTRLGYQPTVPLLTAIQDTAAWYRRAGYL